MSVDPERLNNYPIETNSTLDVLKQSDYRLNADGVHEVMTKLGMPMDGQVEIVGALEHAYSQPKMADASDLYDYKFSQEPDPADIGRPAIIRSERHDDDMEVAKDLSMTSTLHFLPVLPSRESLSDMSYETEERHIGHCEREAARRLVNISEALNPPEETVKQVNSRRGKIFAALGGISVYSTSALYAPVGADKVAEKSGTIGDLFIYNGMAASLIGIALAMGYGYCKYANAQEESEIKAKRLAKQVAEDRKAAKTQQVLEFPNNRLIVQRKGT